MKVILNKDLASLGEEGDVKEVAKGYARNFLFPKGIALPYTERMIKLIESRRAEIEARKEEKRKDALGIGEKLANLELSITMPAGANGKLYGAVTNQTIADELAKNGFNIERKRIELSGNGFKSVGKYKALVKLYENQSAEISINIIAAEIKSDAPPPSKPARRSRRDEQQEQEAASTADTAVENAQSAAVEAAEVQPEASGDAS